MVVWRIAAVAALALMSSCTSIFDSYYSDSLEYLEAQTDLQSDVGGRPLVSVHMKMLPATGAHSEDILAVIADTDDGAQTALFYDSKMKKQVSYKRSFLETLYATSAFSLYPIAQDLGGLSMGAVRFSFATFHSTTPVVDTALTSPWASFLTPGSGNANGGGFSQYQAVYYEDPVGSGTNYSFPAVFSQGSLAVWANPIPATPTLPYTKYMGDLSSVSSPANNLTVGSSPGITLTNLNPLGVTAWNKKYYLLSYSNSTAYVATLNAVDPTNWTSATVAAVKPKNNNGVDLSQGWATATAAILSSHSDNTSLLTAFSWSGQDLGSLRVAASDNNNGGSNSGNSVAYAFHPNGQYWFVYDPANHRISKYKAWW